jgi:DNA processing protein
LTSRPLSERERIDWLRLARTDAIGAVTFAHLISRYGSASAAIRQAPGLALRGGRTTPIAITGVDTAEAELSQGLALGARLIAACEPDYPALLAALDPPPPLIWVLGDIALAHRPSIAIVGARSASTAGQRFARDIAAAMGEAGYTVVSGLARGIDTAAHQGSLAHGAVAVLAGGVDDIYPAENGGLYSQMCARGCVVSERPIGRQARAADFPRRNRIISGLALGVIVVEAELRSGSLITARIAGEQGRDVFAVPGSPMDPRSRGTNDLIRQGATLVEEVDDVLRVLDSQTGFRAPQTYGWDGAGEAQAVRSDADFDALRSTLEAGLSFAPVSINELVRAAGAPVADVLAALAELAIAGRAELLPGGLVVLLSQASR